jgi:hypothetical protein
LPAEVLEVSLRWTGSDYARQAQHQQKDIPAHANQIQRSRKSYDPLTATRSPPRKAKVGAMLLCFCFECEHVGPRVMPGHIESQKLVVTSAVVALVMSPKSGIVDNALNMNTG